MQLWQVLDFLDDESRFGVFFFHFYMLILITWNIFLYFSLILLFMWFYDHIFACAYIHQYIHTYIYVCIRTYPYVNVDRVCWLPEQICPLCVLDLFLLLTSAFFTLVLSFPLKFLRFSVSVGTISYMYMYTPDGRLRLSLRLSGLSTR